MWLKVGDRTYELWSVVRHEGSSLDHGHYVTVARVQTGNFWMEFDDSKAVAIVPDEALEQQAYLLVYAAVSEEKPKKGPFRKG